MRRIYEFSGRNVTVFGLGPTGLSLARYAAKRGASVTVRDTREAPPALDALRKTVPSACFSVGQPDAQSALSADIVLVSPGVSVNERGIAEAKGRGVPVVGDVELFATHIPDNVFTVGITGSNGKTTTTSLTGHICQTSKRRTLVAGNIGNAVLDELEAIEGTQGWPDVIVLELSSFQLETTRSLRCNAATVLNISEDHLDRYPSVFDYAHAKSGLFAQTALQIVNRDDPVVRLMQRADRAAVSFGDSVPENGQWGVQGGALTKSSQEILSISQLKIAGRHNVMNALAALALIDPLGLAQGDVIASLTDFAGLPHRMQEVANIDGVSYIDDSKATNVGAVVAALTGLNKQAVLIAGGDGKGQDFSPLLQAVASHARAVVLIGADANNILSAISSSGVPICFAKSMHEAVEIAKSLAVAGDAVLLSPACASFDMFRNYVHRSEVFCAAVGAMNHA